MIYWYRGTRKHNAYFKNFDVGKTTILHKRQGTLSLRRKHRISRSKPWRRRGIRLDGTLRPAIASDIDLGRPGRRATRVP